MNNTDNTNSTKKDSQTVGGSNNNVAAKPDLIKPASTTAAQPSVANVLADKKTETASIPSLKNQASKLASASTAKTAEKMASAKSSAGTVAKESIKKSSNVVSMSASAAREAVEQSTAKSKKLQAKIVSASMNSAEQIAKSADMASRLMNESLAISREHIEACAEAGNIAAECASRMSESFMNYANKAITDNVEISKDFFSCRTASDVFELQNRLAQSNVERFLNESARMMDMFFSMTSKATEPFSERMTDVVNRLNVTFK